MSATSPAESIRPFFEPRAVALVGASRRAGSIGARLLEELLRAGYTGRIYPVNPRAQEIASLKAYPSVRDIPDVVDLAIIATPRKAVLGTVDDCAARGVRALVVITAGFSETGNEGRALQDELLAKVRGYGMRMVGPNCMGLLNTDPNVRLNASFSPVFPPSGSLAMSSQSGALGLAILSLAADKQLGLSTFVSVGNKADVSSNDLIEYWEQDPATRVILLYLESFGNPRRFSRIARRVGRTKPIVAVKSGRSVSGKRAAGSHTAALASNDVATDALFVQAGVLRAETLDELFEIAAVLSSQPLIKGRRIGILTNAGGPGILCADACEAGGLFVPELGEATVKALRDFLPAAASASNPVDMVASAGPDCYRKAAGILLHSPDIDALIIIYIPLDRNDRTPFVEAISEGIASARQAGQSIPVLACMMEGRLCRSPLRTETETVPVYEFPETPAKVLAKCVRYADWIAETPGKVPEFRDVDLTAARRIVDAALDQRGPGWLRPEEAAALLEAFRIPRIPGTAAGTAEEAVAAAARIGYPVALKLVSATITHKTEIGGVRLDLKDATAVRSAFEAIRGQLSAVGKRDAMQGVLVQPMVIGGVELMVGVTSDRVFGPLMAFGLGGIHVELLGDVRFRITPLTDKDAHAMVKEIRGYRLLEGYRGHPPADIPAVEGLMLRVSKMVEDLPAIGELDLNPVVALPPGRGCLVLDARIWVTS